MRKEFSNSIEKLALKNEKIIFLTGDLGFMALENIQNSLKDRFINAGVSEQNMISMAAGLASQGFIPICYSIAPFSAFRPYEQIRLDVCLHNMNVKIVGNGGGYGYGIMGATHHAIEDLAALSPLQNMKCFIPYCNEDVDTLTCRMLEHKGPSYLRLGYGLKSKNIIDSNYEDIRYLTKGEDITIIGVGPVILNALKVLDENKTISSDIFVVSELPCFNLNTFYKSITKTKKLIIIEEHVKRGGLGELLALIILERGIQCKIKHLYAQGYPNGLYGSQSYHQKINNLDSESILIAIKELTN